ncbi:hypothetical protein EJ06DRAFT_266822 [Trichodelitschia bisporula]|uniref:Uncharacterized protein n=1 Tax=Trichodelitschia bisporula TaxID=703511 RepID=A0A6G1HIR9_9PEZI|nr:hypothetical protein EJ06DRAFT_266822 [Trichodelitschia bisporula]
MPETLSRTNKIHPDRLTAPIGCLKSHMRSFSEHIPAPPAPKSSPSSGRPTSRSSARCQAIHGHARTVSHSKSGRLKLRHTSVPAPHLGPGSESGVMKSALRHWSGVYRVAQREERGITVDGRYIPAPYRRSDSLTLKIVNYVIPSRRRPVPPQLTGTTIQLQSPVLPKANAECPANISSK